MTEVQNQVRVQEIKREMVKEKAASWWEGQMAYEKARHANIMEEIAALKKASIRGFVRDKAIVSQPKVQDDK